MIAVAHWSSGISLVWIDLLIYQHLARMVRMDQLNLAERFLQK
ncbi:hypothetical protein CU012_1577 [Enterococcus faecium]|nr:hypothetical protein [Enterococcus faecium]MBK4880484.1 hypothetical protein [Enterococcus faecium]